MKKSFFLIVVNLNLMLVSAQQELHIHHINIENGDATLIGIYDVTRESYTAKILIDGGQSTPSSFLLPYIKKMVGDNQESYHFDYIILTHYHNDHYNGLLALKNGKITADSIIDPGGYRVNSIFKSGPNTVNRPANMKLATPWLATLKAASHHTPVSFIKGRSMVFSSFGTNPGTSIGKELVLGRIGTTKVVLQCIAGWGNTLSDNGVEPNHNPGLTNANNYTLAFILSCGEFRYLIGGDMGGQNTSEYIDQESIVTKYLVAAYPVSFSADGKTLVRGHVCGFKADHHGSQNSNDEAFIEGMHPSIIVTSAGNNNNWHLPNPAYLQNVVKVKVLSESPLNDSTFNQGIYFTNLYNFKSASCRTEANSLFKNKPGVSYDNGNNGPNLKGSYLIKITHDNALNERSVFEAGRVDIDKQVPYTRLALFNCHSK